MFVMDDFLNIGIYLIEINVTVSERNFLGDVYSYVECLPNVTSTEFTEIMWTSALDFPGKVVC